MKATTKKKESTSKGKVSVKKDSSKKPGNSKSTTNKATSSQGKKKNLTSSKTTGDSSKKARVKKLSSSKAKELKVGQLAPVVALMDGQGKKVTLSDFRGKRVVLFFYPKDDTPGCTKEACSFRDGLSVIRKSGAVVLGVSPDSVESHKKFSNKFSLNFPLLSDVDKKVVEAFGVWKEKSLYGRKYMGVERTTFIISEQGKIGKVFPKVKVDGHFEEVLEALNSLDS
jgi:peroxiredoxin Q/BCP